MKTFQDVADEAFADFLKKHGHATDLKDALKRSARSIGANDNPKRRSNRNRSLELADLRLSASGHAKEQLRAPRRDSHPEEADQAARRRARRRGRPDPDRRRKQVFDAFFNVVKSDETYAREMCRFWFEQAYADLKKQLRSKKK